MPLTDVAIRNAKAGAKPLRLFDGDGLYLEVAPSGGKWWRLKYRFGGKEKRLSLGVYPDIGLRDARDRCSAARKHVANGVDPSDARRAEKASRADAGANSFEAVAREWYAKNKPAWAPSHSEKIIRRLDRDVFPWIGTKHVGAIKPPELLSVFKRIEARGAIETAHRAQQNCGQVLRYAVATGRAESDPSRDLRRALAPWKPQHYPSITDPRKVGYLLRDIDGYDGGFVTKCALGLSPLLFVRPGELRRAEWTEFNLEAAEWRIPAVKMKSRVMHIVPLSRQALTILLELQPLTGGGRWVFPGVRRNGEPMSENTVNAALRRLGYDRDTMTAHGFRSMASTILHERGWESDVIERQLSHGEKNEVKAAYNHAEHLPKRREMMQAWADFLDSLRQGAAIAPLRAA
jgi:integrase